MKKILIIFLLCPLLAFAKPGWKLTTDANAVLYEPTRLSSKKLFKLKFYKVNLKGMDKKTWVIQHAKKQQAALGNAIKKWEIKPEGNEWSIANEYKSGSKGVLIVAYGTGTLANGNPYVYQMLASYDLGVLLVYGPEINKLKPDAEKKLMALQTNTPKIANTKTPQPPKVRGITRSNNNAKGLVSPAEFKKMSGKKYRQYLSSHIRTQPNKGLNPSSLEAVLVNTNLNVIRGRLDSDTYLLFKDGTAYGDCKIPIQDLNVKMSKILEGPAYSKYPKWTRWKKKGGKYYIQNIKTKQWKLLKKAQKALPGKKGERLNNTFWTFSGNQFFGSHQGYYKLMPNGRFEIYNFTMRQNDLRAQDMDGTIPYLGAVRESDKTGSTANSVAIGNNFGGGASHKRKDGNKNTGTYYIDGYTIEFHHDNGWVRRELFHFPSKDKKKSIHIKDTVYWIREYD